MCRCWHGLDRIISINTAGALYDGDTIRAIHDRKPTFEMGKDRRTPCLSRQGVSNYIHLADRSAEQASLEHTRMEKEWDINTTPARHHPVHRASRYGSQRNQKRL